MTNRLITVGPPANGWPVFIAADHLKRDIENPDHWHLFEERSYISGPMRGYPGCNFPAFDVAAKDLRHRLGIFVFSPAEHDRAAGFEFDWSQKCSNEDLATAGFGLEGAILWDLEVIITKITDLHLLPGWGASSGARLELEAARFAKRRIWHPDTRYINGDKPGWILERA